MRSLVLIAQKRLGALSARLSGKKLYHATNQIRKKNTSKINKEKIKQGDLDKTSRAGLADFDREGMDRVQRNLLNFADEGLF